MKTLAELNAHEEIRDVRNTFTLKRSWAVGSQSRRWASSPKVHLLRIDRVIATGTEWKPGFYRVGQVYRASAPCNGNGQHTGTVAERLDTDAISCTKCLKRLAELSAD